MRTLFWTLVILTAAVALALLAQYNHGSVLLVLPPWRVDVSLNFFIVALSGLFFLFYALLRVLAITFNFPGKVRQYRERRDREGAFDAFRLALQAYLEGRFGRAEKIAQTARWDQNFEALVALIAARSTHKLQAFDRRDAWLSRAAADPSVRTARLMTQAELHLEAHDAAAALDTIRELHSSGARHVQAIRLEFLACQQAELWDEVIRLSRLLDKRKAMHPAVLSQARARAYIELIQRRGGDASSLRQLWGDMTTADRATSAVVHAAARAFADLGEHAHAVQILQHALNHDWQPGLVLLYGQMGGDETISAQIHTAEIWLHHHAQDVALLSTLGKLCMRAQLWGKAADYLQRSLRVETTRYALLTLAQLMEHNGDEEQANHYYRECALFNQVVSQ